MLLKGLLLLLAVCLFSSGLANSSHQQQYDNQDQLSADDDNSNLQLDFHRQRRDVRRTYCGERLHDVFQLVCENIRRKRNASPGPSFPSSSLFTSVYRPSLEEDRFMNEENQWNYESPIGQRDRFRKVEFLRSLQKRALMGISDVCCRRPCTIPEMVQFC
jgi:hypothetical protein